MVVRRNVILFRSMPVAAALGGFLRRAARGENERMEPGVRPIARSDFPACHREPTGAAGSEMQVRALRCEHLHASPSDALRRARHQNRFASEIQVRRSSPLGAARRARSRTVSSDVGTDLSDQCCLVYSPSHRLRMAVGPSRHAGRSHEWHAPRTYPQPHRRGSIRNLRRRVMHDPQPSIMSDFAAIDRPLCSGTAFPLLRR